MIFFSVKVSSRRLLYISPSPHVPIITKGFLIIDFSINNITFDPGIGLIIHF